MLIGAILALRLEDTPLASIGIIIGIAIIAFYNRNFPSVLIFVLYIPLNIHFMYIPILFASGKTFNALINIIGFVGVLVVLLLKFSRNKSIIRINSYSDIMLLYALVSLIYYAVNSYINEVSVIQTVWQMAPLMYGVMLLYLIQKKERYKEEFFIVLILSAVIFVGIGFVELFRRETYFYSVWAGGERFRYGILRAGSTLEDPNILAEFCVPLIFLACTQKVKNLIGETQSNVLAVVFTIMVVLTNSRMALLALMCGYVFYCLIYSKSWKRGVAVLICILCIIFLPMIFTIFNSQDADSSGMRLFLIMRAFSYFKSHFLFGIGFRKFQLYESWLTMNEWMKQLSEFGIFGFLLYLSFYIIAIASYLKNRNKLKKIHQKDFALILSGVVAFAINSFSLDTYYHYIMWIIPGMIAAFGELQIRKRPIKSE